MPSALENMMASDLAAIVSASGDMPVIATLTAAGTSTAHDIVLFFGDAQDVLNGMATGVVDGRTVPAVANRSDVIAAIGRDLVPGDVFTIASGVNAGSWPVISATADTGGGVNLTLESPSILAASRRQQ